MIVTESLINRLFENEDELKNFVLNQNLIDIDIDNFQLEVHEDSPTETVTIDGEQVEATNYTDESKAVIAIQGFLGNLKKSDIILLGSSVVETYKVFSPLEGIYYSFATEDEAVVKAKDISKSVISHFNVHVSKEISNEHGHCTYESTGKFINFLETM